jgi:hypothetical protein
MIGSDWRKFIAYGCVLCPKVTDKDGETFGFEAETFAAFDAHVKATHPEITPEMVKTAKGQTILHIGGARSDKTVKQFEFADGRPFFLLQIVYVPPKRVSKTRSKQRR